DGTPAGVKEEGGLLEQPMREIRVLCTPSNIPEAIHVNVEELEMNSSISIEEIKVDDEIEILDAPEQVVAAVVFVKEVELEPVIEDEELEPGLVGEEGEEGEDGVEGEEGADAEADGDEE
ncbi:MAG: hypothetical protein HKN33_17550, partial [Pyrinomonadaceae bacterium]|nr:hypothetical protein [Pyrinomonadaceae bacterium]